MSCDIKRVVVDIIAINKIQKHGQKEIEKGLMGQLCGIYNKESQEIEVSNCFALPDMVMEEVESKEQLVQQQEQNRKVKMQYEEFSIKQFEQMKLDSSYVGWYNVGSQQESLVSEQFWIQYKYQKNIPFAIYLVYDPNYSYNNLKAYRISKKVFRLLNLSKKNESVQQISIERIQQIFFSDKLFQEIPVSIKINPVQQMFMSQFQQQIINSSPNFKFDLNDQFIKSTRTMIEGLEELDSYQLAANDEVLKNKDSETHINYYDINSYIDVLTSINHISTQLQNSNSQYQFLQQANNSVL